MARYFVPENIEPVQKVQQGILWNEWHPESKMARFGLDISYC
jgi:hypothetical protein